MVVRAGLFCLVGIMVCDYCQDCFLLESLILAQDERWRRA
jgi:hypothetical protein